jgi:hypothetical protein
MTDINTQLWQVLLDPYNDVSLERSKRVSQMRNESPKPAQCKEARGGIYSWISCMRIIWQADRDSTGVRIMRPWLKSTRCSSDITIRDLLLPTTYLSSLRDCGRLSEIGGRTLLWLPSRCCDGSRDPRFRSSTRSDCGRSGWEDLGGGSGSRRLSGLLSESLADALLRDLACPPLRSELEEVVLNDGDVCPGPADGGGFRSCGPCAFLFRGESLKSPSEMCEPGCAECGSPLLAGVCGWFFDSLGGTQWWK